MNTISEDSDIFPVYKPSMKRLLVNLLVFGPPGVGKTTFIASGNSHPAFSPMLLGNVEGGIMSLADMENPPDIFDFEGDITNLEKLYMYLATEDHGYKSVALDSLSELQRLHRENLVASRAAAGRRDDMFDVQQKDWGDNMNYILYWMRKFRDLPLHFLATCHSEQKVKPDGSERVYPLLNKALVEPMCGIFDIVGYLFSTSSDSEDEEDETAVSIRKMLCEPRTINGIEFYAKDRSPGGKIGRVVKNPTLPMIYSRITRVKAANSTQPTKQTTVRKQTTEGKTDAKEIDSSSPDKA